MAAPAFPCRCCFSSLFFSSSPFSLTSAGALLCNQHHTQLDSSEFLMCDLLSDDVILLFANTENNIQALRNKNASHALAPLSDLIYTSTQIRIAELLAQWNEYYSSQQLPEQSSLPTQNILQLPVQNSLPAQSPSQLPVQSSLQQLSDENWLCLVCSHSNNPANKICYVCRKPQGTQDESQSNLNLAPIDIAPLPDSFCDESGMWICPKQGCGRRIVQAQKTCGCGYTNLELIESEVIEEVPPPVVDNSEVYRPTNSDNMPWTCSNCNYEYNMGYFEECQKCKNPNPMKEQKDKAKGDAGPSLQHCLKCASNYAQAPDFLCQKCSESFEQGRMVEQAQEERKEPGQVLATCEMCKAPGLPGTFEHGRCAACITSYMSAQQSPFQMDSLVHACAECGEINPRETTYCTECVLRGRKPCPSCLMKHAEGISACSKPQQESLPVPREEKKDEAESTLCSKCNNGLREEGPLCNQCARTSKSEQLNSELQSSTGPPATSQKQYYCVNCKKLNCQIPGHQKAAS